MKQEFHLGDRVSCLVDNPDSNEFIEIGSEGVVCREPTENDRYVAVRWDENVHGHDCAKSCDYGHGWNMYFDEIELVCEHVQESESDSYDVPDEEISEFIFGGVN